MKNTKKYLDTIDSIENSKQQPTNNNNDNKNKNTFSPSKYNIIFDQFDEKTVRSLISTIGKIEVKQTALHIKRGVVMGKKGFSGPQPKGTSLIYDH